MRVTLKTPKNKTKRVPIGINWVFFLFSYLTLLFRADITRLIGYAFLRAISMIIFLFISKIIGFFIMVGIQLFFTCNYNQWYIKRKLETGWTCETEKDRQILIEKGIIKTTYDFTK
ncbi:hypothetical protein [Listeria costaricensis]|uniref:hypothetical protein n=1 Tax=Listeria costaricensis TaxID=2026604 RepID=UPI000C075219|nr:hypothetical protein [Listeria costaricensis]